MEPGKDHEIREHSRGQTFETRDKLIRDRTRNMRSRNRDTRWGPRQSKGTKMKGTCDSCDMGQ